VSTEVGEETALVTSRIPHQFSALRHRDFRVFWTGAFLSFIGNWVQTVAQGQLVYTLTGDPFTLGLVAFSGQIPIFFLTPFFGLVADVLDKRKIVLFTQASLGVTALILGGLVWFEIVKVWHIILLSTINGVIWALDVPARQSLVSELVTEEDIPNAIPLTGATFNIARLLGPAVGGILLASVGLAWCFIVNGLSYSTMLIGLLLVRNRRNLKVATDSQTFLTRITEGLRTVLHNAAFRTLILLEISVSVFGLFYISQMPAFNGIVSHGDDHILGYLYTATGVGAVAALGTLAWLSRAKRRGRFPALAMIGFSLCVSALGFVGLMHGSFRLILTLSLVCLVGTGFFGTTILNGCNTLLQSNAPEHLRGRVVAVHFWAIGGFGPIGNLICGALARAFGVPQAYMIGGAICLVIGLSLAMFARSVDSLK